jgi:pimeloyl-ACP methyl ester carboxylesterase
LYSIGRYYFPEALWGDPATREILMSVFIDATRLRRVSGGLGELQNWQKARGSYVRQVTHLAHKPGMKFLIFAGTDDGAVSEKHSREALAKLSGVPLSVIPRDEPWQNENLGWYPLVGAKHLPMLERSDEMAKGYAAFLRKR